MTFFLGLSAGESLFGIYRAAPGSAYAPAASAVPFVRAGALPHAPAQAASPAHPAAAEQKNFLQLFPCWLLTSSCLYLNHGLLRLASLGAQMNKYTIDVFLQPAYLDL
jgi:hypothetical protein